MDASGPLGLKSLLQTQAGLPKYSAFPEGSASHLAQTQNTSSLAFDPFPRAPQTQRSLFNLSFSGLLFFHWKMQFAPIQFLHSDRPTIFQAKSNYPQINRTLRGMAISQCSSPPSQALQGLPVKALQGLPVKALQLTAEQKKR